MQVMVIQVVQVAVVTEALVLLEDYVKEVETLLLLVPHKDKMVVMEILQIQIVLHKVVAVVAEQVEQVEIIYQLHPVVRLIKQVMVE